MKKTLLVAIIFGLALPAQPVYALFDSKAKAMQAQLEEELSERNAEVLKLTSELETVKMDRDSLVKQARSIQKEKEAIQRQLVESKGFSAGAETEINSLKQEIEIRQAEIENLKAAQIKDEKAHGDEKDVLKRELENAQARANSFLNTMEKYTPEKIQELLADRNRLEEENQRMAQRVFEYEKRMEELRRQMTPLELDREELQRVHQENRELYQRVRYVEKLEATQGQLIAENAQYREEVEVLKAKFKESVPGLAKASRVSQKMMRENASMHYNLGTIFLQNKMFREAIKEYERVLELRPNDPDTHYNLGILYDDYRKDREKALYHFQQYLAVNPKSPDARKVERYILSLELQQKVR